MLKATIPVDFQMRQNSEFFSLEKLTNSTLARV
jgi:hypothetical protein